MKHRIICLLLAACILLSLGTPGVRAAEPRRHSVTITAAPMAEQGITWEVNDGLLTISGKGAVPDYAQGEAPWLEEEVFSIIIEDGITALGSNAFRGMEKLQEVIFGRGVRDLGESVFADCPQLKSALFLGNIPRIPGDLFQGCVSMSTYRFAGDAPVFEEGSMKIEGDYISVDYNGRNATWKTVASDPRYSGCFRAYKHHADQSGTCGENLTWQIMRSEVSYIYDYLVITGTGPMYDYAEGEAPWMPYAYSFFGIYMSPGISYIGANAFNNADISTTNLPGSVREIGANAFRKNPDMTYMVLRENIRKVGDGAYAYSGVNGVNVYGPAIELGVGVYEGCPNLTKEDFPAGMTYIPERTFKDCKNLREITIPTDITRIDAEAFSGCTRLKTVNFHGIPSQWEDMQIAQGNEPLLSAEVTGLLTNSGTCGADARWELSEDFTLLTISGTGSVDSDPWSNAAGYVEKVIVEEGITRLAGYVLSDLEVVTEIILPSTLTAVGVNCFYWNPKLETIELPAGLTTLGRNTFNGCTSLRSIEIPSGVTELPEGVFARCTALETVTLHKGLTTVWDRAFEGCTKLSEISLPSTVKVIRDEVFDGCSSLTHLDWPTAVTTIGTALHGSGLTEFTVPDTVTTIGYRAFEGCSRLQTVIIPDSVTSLGYSVFADTPSLESVEIPESITELPNGCFERSGLREIILPDTLTVIGHHAFADCRRLEQVTIPESIRVMEQGAFYCASALREVNIPAGLEKLPYHAFYKTALTEMTVPATIREVDDMAFAGCPDLVELVFEGRDTVMTGDSHFLNSPNLTIHCWYGSQVQTQAERQLIPYILFDPPADRPVYPVFTSVIGAGTLTADPAESVGYEWITIEAVPDEGHYLAAMELYYYAEYELDIRAEQIDENTFRLLMPKCPVEIFALFLDERMPFVDVYPTDFFYNSVIWAVEQGITSGLDATHFGPAASCNRAQVVTFLWKAEGAPEPESSLNPFVDVPAGSWFEKAVLWAVEQGITSGTDACHFSPGLLCNRATVATFLWSAAGKPETAGENPFTDVPAGSWYEMPVRWAKEQGITSGISDTEFGAAAVCNRAQVVTFLYKAYN